MDIVFLIENKKFQLINILQKNVILYIVPYCPNVYSIYVMDNDYWYNCYEFSSNLDINIIQKVISKIQHSRTWFYFLPDDINKIIGSFLTIPISYLD